MLMLPAWNTPPAGLPWTGSLDLPCLWIQAEIDSSLFEACWLINIGWNGCHWFSWLSGLRIVTGTTTILGSSLMITDLRESQPPSHKPIPITFYMYILLVLLPRDSWYKGEERLLTEITLKQRLGWALQSQRENLSKKRSLSIFFKGCHSVTVMLQWLGLRQSLDKALMTRLGHYKKRHQTVCSLLSWHISNE